MSDVDEPEVARAAYIDPTARLFGDLRLGEGASIWPHAVLRAEMHHIRIGPLTNVQDHVMIHIGYRHAVDIGSYCSIAHHSTLHGCTIGDNCLIGIHTTIMDGCVIGENSIVGGHSFLTENTIIPPNSIVMGAPGKIRRSQDCSVENIANALLYELNARAYARGHHRAWADADFAKIQRQAREIAMARQAIPGG
ncbi:transferase hexapeptide repeat containing protein [Rhizorhabdus wittichii RW1]|uniref:Transferase hexapeptide repeat containing protein n=1 Tax=Rhizorhabdus wittichii (strain DSM 6014 / CCUG 31198 / JCM 15750 / NBRC 105917 / EY 4224 / RW1) TaxID=392499 RepID=A0A9J9HAV3_RHIWR|nr:transferase hexapeptide repeat containing protein [Rhizorhabdus wittichii RW1]